MSHADDIINGDVDQHTGEWLGDGQGFPRSGGNFYGYKPKGQRQKTNEIYAWIKQMLQANPNLAKQLDNKRAVIIFLNTFFLTVGVRKEHGKMNWKEYADIKEHKEAFKKYINER